MTRWAMVADLRRCVGCQTCTSACKHTNATPPLVQWRRVLDIESGEYPNVSRTFVPVGCMHCADPPCMHVCPSTATRQREDGIVTIDYDLCIGCAFCAVACPYQARYKVDKPLFAYGKAETRNEAAREDPRRLGVAQKCTFCSDRIDFGLENGLTPGIDAAATPACVNSCIADALHFGDSDDPDSNISQLLRENRNFGMHEELGTAPGFHYLWDGNRESLDDAIGAAEEKPAERRPDADVHMPGVVPWHQLHWDWRAAGNFMLGGTGSGLLAGLALAGVAGISAPALNLLGLGLVGLGLFLVWLEIGRPWRFLHVALHPQASWMTREALAAVLLFASALASFLVAESSFSILTGALALLFLYCQGRILRQSKGIPVWREPRIVALIVASGLTEGCGLLLVGSTFLPIGNQTASLIATALLILAAYRAYCWRGYRRGLTQSGAPTQALDVLEQTQPWILAIGTLAPAALVVAGTLLPIWSTGLFAVAGISALAAGWLFKFTLVTRAAYNQGFALDHVPARGSSGGHAGIKPGWR